MSKTNQEIIQIVEDWKRNPTTDLLGIPGCEQYKDALQDFQEFWLGLIELGKAARQADQEWKQKQAEAIALHQEAVDLSNRAERLFNLKSLLRQNPPDYLRKDNER